MYSVFQQAFFGFFWVVIFFVTSFLLVVGGKFVYLSVIEILSKKRKPTNPPKPEKAQPPPVPKKAAKPIRSIEINPDEVDRIRFKKTS